MSTWRFILLQVSKQFLLKQPVQSSCPYLPTHGGRKAACLSGLSPSMVNVTVKKGRKHCASAGWHKKQTLLSSFSDFLSCRLREKYRFSTRCQDFPFARGSLMNMWGSKNKFLFFTKNRYCTQHIRNKCSFSLSLAKEYSTKQWTEQVQVTTRQWQNCLSRAKVRDFSTR